MPTCTCGIRPAPTGTRTCRGDASWTWATCRGCRAASTCPPTSPSPPVGTSRSWSTSPPPPGGTRSTRPSSSTGERTTDGHPDAHHRRLAAHRLGGRGGGRARPADGGAPLSRRPPDGRSRGTASLGRGASRAGGARPVVRGDGPPRPAGGRGHGGWRPTTTSWWWSSMPGGRATDPTRSVPSGPRGSTPSAGLGDNVLCKLSGLAGPLGSMARRRAGPVARARHRRVRRRPLHVREQLPRGRDARHSRRALHLLLGSHRRPRLRRSRQALRRQRERVYRC